MMYQIIISAFLLLYVSGQWNSRPAELCAFDAVCENTVDSNIYSFSNFCKPCICYGNCTEDTLCPKFDGINHYNEECRHEHSFYDIADIDSAGFSQRQYFVVFGCPSDVDKELISACESNLINNASLYVSSVSTYRIYKNKYCAQCNGENNYVEWRKAVSVDPDELNLMLNNLNTEQIIKILKTRFLYSIPPHDYPEGLNICNQNVMGKCNQSGLWDMYDENIEALCGHSMYMLAKSREKIEPRMYRNVYCSLCNNKIFRDNCTAVNPSGMKTLIPGSSMERLISWKEEDPDYPDYPDQLHSGQAYDHPCLNYQMFDHYQGECLNISCPVGQMAVAGECRKATTTIEGTTLYVFIDYHLSEPSSSVDEDSLNKLVEVWINEQFVNCGCTYCVPAVPNSLVDDCKCTYVSFILDNQCDNDKLVESLQEFENTIADDVTLVTDYSYSFNVTLYLNIQRVEMYPQFFETCPTDVKLWKRYYCTAVVLSAGIVEKLRDLGLEKDLNELSEYLENDKREVTSSEVTSSQEDRIICLSDYRSMLRKLSNGTSRLVYYITLVYLSYALYTIHYLFQLFY